VHTLVTSLKNQGVSISLDDFGTGYSSLAQLRQLPFDRIKIDRSFVTSLADNADSRTIVETVCVLGKGMDLPVSAVGVETQGVLDVLKALGHFRAQGHVLGLPQPAEGTLRLIIERGLIAPASARDAAPPPTRPRSASLGLSLFGLQAGRRPHAPRARLLCVFLSSRCMGWAMTSSCWMREKATCPPWTPLWPPLWAIVTPGSAAISWC
jgi:hypothetical protein